MNHVVDTAAHSSAQRAAESSTSSLAETALAPLLKQAAATQSNLIQQRWAQQKHAAKKRWTLLHLDELEKVNGDADALVALVCERYALSQDEVEKQVRHFLSSYTPAVTFDVFHGQWASYISAAKARWSTLHNQELHQIKGNKENLTDLIRRRYGLSGDEARAQVNQFVSDCAIVPGKTK